MQPTQPRPLADAARCGASLGLLLVAGFAPAPTMPSGRSKWSRLLPPMALLLSYTNTAGDWCTSAGSPQRPIAMRVGAGYDSGGGVSARPRDSNPLLPVVAPAERCPVRARSASLRAGIFPSAGVGVDELLPMSLCQWVQPVWQGLVLLVGIKQHANDLVNSMLLYVCRGGLLNWRHHQ